MDSMAQVAATAAEQFFMELMNRARLNPTAEAALHGIDLNSGLAAGTLNTSQRQVLAINPFINQAADGHSNWLRSSGNFDHTGSGGTNAQARMVAEGYNFTGAWSWGENLAWIGSSGTINVEDFILSMHHGLFLSVGHRQNTLNNSFREAGVGLSDIGPYQGYANGLVATQNFALSGSNVFVTGVNYTDTDGDNFYSIGEGVGSRTVQLYQNGVAMLSMASTAAGGYSVATSGTGTIEARFSGGGLAAPMGASFSMGGQNVKIDLVNGNTILSSHSATLTGAALNLTLLGINANSATGNSLNNEIHGNSAANTLNGNAGNDTLSGGAGTDTLGGGGGRDVGVFAGLASGATINFAGLTTSVTTGAGGTDTLTNVEVLQFDDRMVVIEDPITDFNADATSDLLLFQASTGTARIATMSNHAVVSSAFNVGVAGPDWVVQTTGDVNGDGSSDLIWKKLSTGQFSIWNFSNNALSQTGDLGIISPSWDVKAGGDFNADGTGDLLWRDSTNGHLVLFMMQNNGVAGITDLSAPGAEWSVKAIGDFNGDGTSDIALSRSTDGRTYLWGMGNGDIVSFHDFGTIATTWNIMGAGDFNSDGTDDLVWRDSSNGHIILWTMQNNAIKDSIDLGIIGTSWTVDAVADTDGDFTSDILLKNTSTGQFYLWGFTGNATIDSFVSLGTIGTDWELV
jgi:RTX calcium-binding nonapeptide repeat (4 copies)/FG-GAP-like repeat/Cysteine-rich secretory protein family